MESTNSLVNNNPQMPSISLKPATPLLRSFSAPTVPGASSDMTTDQSKRSSSTSTTQNYIYFQKGIPPTFNLKINNPKTSLHQRDYLFSSRSLMMIALMRVKSYPHLTSGTPLRASLIATSSAMTSHYSPPDPSLPMRTIPTQPLMNTLQSPFATFLMAMKVWPSLQ